ncbi:MAG: helix-turn-helix transcriptional regulator [Deltaproteobacteria bacterium]|nr:helix-turn-helix transcriptional regulator [Deltaproteobacteria bacterium]
MLEPTKKHHIEDPVGLKFIGPPDKKSEAINLMKSLGFQYDTEPDSIPWRECFPEITDQNLPGKVLAGMRYREELTQARLSSMTGLSRRHISEMENGKRPIDKETARKLAKALRTSYKNFITT